MCIRDSARLAVAERSGAGREDVVTLLGERFPDTPPPLFFDMPRMDISSSLIRRRIAAERPIRYLVPEPVAERIARRRLYR